MAPHGDRAPLVAIPDTQVNEGSREGFRLNSLRALGGAFAAQTAELQTLAALRVDDSTRALFADDLSALEATVSALEATLADIQQAVHKERTDLPRAAAILRRCEAQREQARHMEENLPPFLPGRRGSAGKEQAASLPTTDAAPALSDRHTVALPQGGGAAGAAATSSKGQKRPPTAPRWFVTMEELDSAPGYMKGRVPLDKVNAAVEEIACHAERVIKAIAGARSKSARAGATLGKEAVAVLNSSEKSKAALKGRHWLPESCFREGSQVKLDKSGRALVTLLRHLGRLQEMRFTVGGKQQTILILQAES